MIKTEPLTDVVSNMNAVEFEDYCPKHEKVVFGHGETEKCITIQLVNNKGPEEEMPLKKGEEPEVDGEDEEEATEVKFKIKLEKPEPNGVKISKKNVCIVTIDKSDEEKGLSNEHQKLLEFYL